MTVHITSLHFADEMYEECRKVEDTLKIVNGRRRVRTLEMRELFDADPPDMLHGGHVANAYGYPAFATAALIVEFDGYRHVLLRLANAKKGCSGFGSMARYYGGTIKLNLSDEDKALFLPLPSQDELSIASDIFEEAGVMNKAEFLRQFV